jgi:hypothetical protein
MDTQPEKDDWKPYPASVYREVAAGLVHFSAKGVNSNAEACGVRLDPGAGLPLPYVSARCLLAHGVTLQADYTKNAGHTATVVKQMRKLMSGEHGEVPEEAREALAAIAPALASGYREGTDYVSPRLRQLLLPQGGNDYVAVSPLPCGGLSREINGRLQAHNQAVDDAMKHARESGAGAAEIPRRPRTGILGVGGANPQNVGSLVREMQTVLVFEAPHEDQALRTAYRIHHNGIRLGLPRGAMRAWREWRDQAKAGNGGRIPTDMASREREKTLLLDAIEAVLHSGREALRVLESQAEKLPNGELLSADFEDGAIRGLIDPAARDKEWPRRFGERVAREIGRYSFGQHEGVAALDSDSLALIARWAEEAAR